MNSTSDSNNMWTDFCSNCALCKICLEYLFGCWFISVFIFVWNNHEIFWANVWLLMYSQEEQWQWYGTGLGEVICCTVIVKIEQTNFALLFHKLTMLKVSSKYETYNVTHSQWLSIRYGQFQCKIWKLLGSLKLALRFSRKGRPAENPSATSCSPTWKTLAAGCRLEGS